jgi:holliday junction DNA helicase RuvA
MIARIQGTLDSITNGIALIRIGSEATGSLFYEVQLPAFAQTRLTMQEGKTVTLHTFNFHESQGQGSTMLPRLAGFLTTEDLAFFQLFTTCKGIGFRKALRAMTLQTSQIAAAISDRDAAMLQSLPEVGKRTAETIIASLSGKVDRFVSAAAYTASVTGTSDDGSDTAPPTGGLLSREALETLLALGENRIQAAQWIDRILSNPDDRPTDVGELVSRVLQMKSGG